MATPFLPNRPVRPILWMYWALLLGMSQLMTRLTCCTSMPLPRRSVAIRILEEPLLKSSMTLTLSAISISPVMLDTTNLCSASFSFNSRTLSLRLVKTMHCVIVMFLQSWTRVPNFWLSSSIEMQNCLMPSRVSFSFWTKILTGFFMNWVVISTISGGIVAEKRHTWISAGRWAKIYFIISTKPLLSISSASSRTTDFKKSVLRACFSIRSKILPGVPTTTCIPPSFKAFLSSLGSVPPMRHLDFIFRNSPRQLTKQLICIASSRVGAMMMA